MTTKVAAVSQDRGAEDVRVARDVDSRRSGVEAESRLPGGSVGELSPVVSARLLRSPKLGGSASCMPRAATLRRAQRSRGNRFVQRAIRRSQQCSCGGSCEKCRSASPAPALSAVPGALVPGVVPSALLVQTRSSADADGAVDAPSKDVIPAASHGEPMGEGTRRFMESRYERDFSDVRVHTDASAASSAEALGADAYATGRDIYFAEGKYAPQTPAGQHLLAHELAHTVQREDMRGGEAASIAARGEGDVVVGRHDDPLEHEAERAAAAVTSSARPQVGSLTPDRGGAVRRGVGDALGVAWDATGGRAASAIGSGAQWVGNKAVEGYESVRDWAIEKIDELAPGLLDFLRGDLVELMKEKITAGLDGFLGGLLSQVKKHGLMGALGNVIGDLLGGVTKGAGKLAPGACGVLSQAAQSVFDAARDLGGKAFEKLKTGAAAIGGFLEGLWKKIGAPAWEAIKAAASGAWKWIEEKAKWLWKKIKPVRDAVARAWNWLKEQFNLAVDSGQSAFDWLKKKALAAWDKIKDVIKPILGPLKVVAGVLLLISPVGPILLIWKASTEVWGALKWLWNNWDQIDIVVRARKVLSQQILPTIRAGVSKVGGLLTAAATWLKEKAGDLSKALGKLSDALGISTLLRLAQQGVSFLSEKASKFATWASTQFTLLLDKVKSALATIWEYLRPVLVITIKLAIVVSNPFLLNAFIAIWAWKVLPNCLKPPIIDFILDLMIIALRAIPDFKSFGEVWGQVKQSMLKALVDVRKSSMDRKIEVSNRVADFIVGGDLEPYSNLIDAARQSPDHFMDQMVLELTGMDLTQPLPFERAADPAASGGAGSGVAAVLGRTIHDENSIGVTRVADLDLHPDLLTALHLGPGESREFGENDDPARSIQTIRDELAGDAPADGGLDSGSDGTVGAPVAALTTDQQLEMLMAQETPPTCTKEKPAAGPAAPTEIPQAHKIGPLTQGQRARYLWHQMKKGISNWYECNRTVIWVSLVAALVVLIVAAIFTGGAVLEALPPIMEVVGAIMIGVAMIRVAGYVAEYLGKSILGDVAGAAKSLARGLAVGAVELVFALLFNIGAVIKSMKAGLKVTLKTLEKSARKTLSGTVKAVKTLGTTSVKAGKNIAANTRRFGAVFVKNGRITMRGLKNGFSRGARSLDDLARRLWKRLRFRKFRIRRSGRGFWLEGYINPWVRLAKTGEVKEVDEIPKTARVGDDVPTSAGQAKVLALGDDLPDVLKRRIGSKPLDENNLFELFGVKPLKSSELAPAAAGGSRRYITYVFKEGDKVVYVGKASEFGNPNWVLKRRIAKGHKHFHPGLTAEVVSVQASKAANAGAEEFFKQAYQKLGSTLTNIDEALNISRADRRKKTIAKIAAFFSEIP